VDRNEARNGAKMKTKTTNGMVKWRMFFAVRDVTNQIYEVERPEKQITARRRQVLDGYTLQG